MARTKDGTNGVGALKYFPHLAGSLILATNKKNNEILRLRSLHKRHR